MAGDRPESNPTVGVEGHRVRPAGFPLLVWGALVSWTTPGDVQWYLRGTGDGGGARVRDRAGATAVITRRNYTPFNARPVRCWG